VTTRRILIRASWVPVALWIATLVYISPYDGWGAWAAAPLLVPSVALSAGWAAAGTAMLTDHRWRHRALDTPVLLATVLGGFVLGYYVVFNLTRPY
jgi:hypothetical protein